MISIKSICKALSLDDLSAPIFQLHMYIKHIKANDRIKMSNSRFPV